MEQLISFRKGLDSLNDEEFLSCIKSFGRTEITTILFHGFHQQFKHNKMDKIEKMNKIITEIKISRDEKKMDDINQQNQNDDEDDEDIDIQLNVQNVTTKIDELPSVLLSEISSYLIFSENILFERSNRSIFIGSRSSSISISQHLDGNQFTKLLKFRNDNKNHNIQYQPKLIKFKSLTINANDTRYYDENENNLRIFRNIQELKIKFARTPNVHELDVMSKYMHSPKFVDLQNVKTIRIISDESYVVSYGQRTDIFLSFIKNIFNASNLQFLEFSMYFCSPESIFSAPYEWISKLKGIAINNKYEDEDSDNSLKDIYSVIGNNLESFHKTSSLFIDTINGKLNGLKELCLPWNSSESDINILNQQNLCSIKRVFFHNASAARYNKYTMQVLMDKIIGSAKYIGMDRSLTPNENRTYWKSLDIFDILINSLKSTKKETLKFRINGTSLIEKDVFKIEDVINTLSSHCSNFMFIGNNLNFWRKNNALDNLLELMKDKYSVIYTKNPLKGKNDNFLEYNVVIKNKGCNMCGYHEQWIMQCVYCQQDQLFHSM